MSQDFQQGIFSFPNGLERGRLVSPQQQIRRDKVRFEAAAPLVGIEEEEPVYETAGMLSEMFNFPPATELLEQQHATATFRAARQAGEWYGNRQQQQQISGINADSAAAMQLFLMNPQTRSPSPPQTHATPSSTLHMLLPNPSSNSSLQGFTGSAAGGSFGQFTWVPESAHQQGGVVEGQGLSLSLSSSLEAAKAEELRMGDSGFLYYNHQQGGGGGGGSSSSSAVQFQYKNNNNNHHQALHLQGAMGHDNNHQGHVGFGSSSLGVVNVLRNSKYAKAAQELLEEFCSVGRGQFKKSKTEKNMLIIIDQYKEKVNLAASHGQMLEDEQAKVSTLRVEREAREGVIELLHKEAMKWMDRFALSLNESQELPRLLAKAKAVPDTYSAPDEVHSLFNYCQHMVELMTYIIRNS